MEIVRAKPEDAESLTRISFAAKRHWGYPERWISHWKDALTVTPELINNSEVWAAMEEEAVGFYVLTGTDNVLELEHLWVEPDRIGTGVGRALFEHALGRAASLGATALEVEADPNAEGFYLRMGARRTGENFYEIEGEKRELPVLTIILQQPYSSMELVRCAWSSPPRGRQGS